MITAIGLAVAGAVCFALAAYLQHDVVRHTALSRAVRSPQWLLGLGLIVLGATVHAVALAFAPLVVVQPIGVLALPLVAGLHMRAAGLRPSRFARLAILATTAGVALFVAIAATGAAESTAPLETYASTTWLVGIAVAGLAALGVAQRGRRRCLLVATAAGVAFALVSVLVRGLGHHLATGTLDTVPVIVPVGLIGALVAGGALVQLGYASGPPAVVVACLTIVDPLVSVGVGIGLLGETSASATGWTVATGAGCALLAIAGTVALARHHPEAVARTHDKELACT